MQKLIFKLATFVSHFEGFSAKPYKCPAGVWTIGYGTTRGVNKDTKSITMTQAYNLLVAELFSYAQKIKTYFPTLTEQQVLACTSLVYNIGFSRFINSSIAKNIRRGDFDGACASIALYNKARINGKLTVLKGLDRRRKAEMSIWRNGL